MPHCDRDWLNWWNWWILCSLHIYRTRIEPSMETVGTPRASGVQWPRQRFDGSGPGRPRTVGAGWRWQPRRPRYRGAEIGRSAPRLFHEPGTVAERAPADAAGAARSRWGRRRSRSTTAVPRRRPHGPSTAIFLPATELPAAAGRRRTHTRKASTPSLLSARQRRLWVRSYKRRFINGLILTYFLTFLLAVW